MIESNVKNAYQIMFTEYPDVVNVEQLCSMLDISEKTAYDILKSGKIKSLYFGKRYKIPKLFVIEYLMDLAESGA